MKKILYRSSITLLVVVVSIGLVFLLVRIGDKSRGPLYHFFQQISAGISKLEHRMVKGKNAASRSEALQWFDLYRQDAARLAWPDTVLLGVYDNRTSESFETVVALEDSLGFALPILQVYCAWGSKPNQGFPVLQAQAIHELGSIPMITWEPWLDDFDRTVFPANTTEEEPNKGGLRAIADGAYDAYIDRWAQDAAQFGQRMLIRLGHEMNDPYRYPWGPQNNPPEDYIAAWQHVVDRFRAAGANNVFWIWSPHPAYPPYDPFYPGHRYVDWIGITALNYGTIAPWSQWWTFTEIVGPCYTQLAPYGKPVIITEFGSLAVGGDRAQWFEDALTALPDQYPAIRAMVFFHSSSDNTTTYKALDWTFRTDSLTIAGIRKGLNSTN